MLAAQNIDYATYRDDSRRDLLVEQLEQRDVITRIDVTPRELDLCLAQCRMRPRPTRSTTTSRTS